MREKYGLWVGLAIMATGLAATIGACGGSSSPMSPSGISTGGVPTVTITAAGVSPKEVSVPLNGVVMFVNSDSINRQINSDPFPAHGDCPPVNVGLLTPGQSGQTGPLTSQGVCGFHDHLSEGDSAFFGRILVATDDSDDPPPSGYLRPQ